MVTKFGAFYDSTLDRVGDGATFIGTAVFFLTAPDVALRRAAVIACMVAILARSWSPTRGRGRKGSGSIARWGWLSGPSGFGW